VPRVGVMRPPLENATIPLQVHQLAHLLPIVQEKQVALALLSLTLQVQYRRWLVIMATLP
jgi:hypothetical protein